jgi:hypothetical protein
MYIYVYVRERILLRPRGCGQQHRGSSTNPVLRSDDRYSDHRPADGIFDCNNNII